MKLFKNNKNKTDILSDLLNFFNPIIQIFLVFFKEIYNTFVYASIAIFNIIDFILTKFLNLASYIYYGFVYIYKYLKEYTIIFTTVTYKYFFKYIFGEIYALLRAIYKGSVRFLKFSFYELPVFIFNSFSEFFDIIRKKIILQSEKIKKSLKKSPNKIQNYFLSKWSNLSVVKHYRNKKERELEVLLIDKFGKDAQRTEKKLMYQYLARNKDGKLVKGYFAALSKLDVHSYLLDNGFEVYDIKTNWWINLVHGEKTYLNNQMKNKQLVFWLAQLSTYLKSGIPLTDSVKILAEQDKKKKYQKVYGSIVYELSMGESFSESLNKQNNVFPPLLINMVKAAELIGDLETTLDDMSNYYNEKEITKKQMIGALTYPLIILLLAVLIIGFMMVKIIPQFKRIYTGMNAELKGTTLLILNLSDFLKSYISIIVVTIFILLFVLGILYRKVKAFRMIVQYVYMHIPVVGKLVIYSEMNLFAKTFAVLNKNNIMLTDSIDILSKITTNEFYKMIMYDTISNLLRGEKISLAFKNNWAIPSLAFYMISTGEATGELGTMLEKVSEYYQREQRNLANTLKTLIEPVLMILLALVVGTIMISLLVPMYDIGVEVLSP